jgi:hypothetical protein
MSLGVICVTGAGKDQCVFGDAVLNADSLPLKCAEFGQPTVIALIGGEHSDAQPPGAHRNQCVVGQPPLSDLFVMIFGRQPSKHSAGLSPVAEIGYQESFHPVKISFQSLYHAPLPLTSAGVEFLKHNRTRP